MSSMQETGRPSPHGNETRKNSDRPSSSRTKPSQEDGHNDNDELETQKEDNADDSYGDDEEGTTTDAENKSENDENGAFAPIKSPAQTNEDNRLRASRSIERSWSLNDGYSCHTGDEESGEKIDEEAKVTGAEDPPEFVVAFDENDPMNPRNMSTPRRWLVVIICSLGSICV